MKKYGFLMIMFIYTHPLYAQEPNYGFVVETNGVEQTVNSIIASLEYSLNQSNTNTLNFLLTQEAINSKSTPGNLVYYNIKLLKINTVGYNKLNDNIEVKIQTDIYTDSGEKIIKFDTLSISKFSNIWKISALNGFSDVFQSMVKNNNPTLIKNTEDFSLIDQYLSDRTFIPKLQILNPAIYEINANLTMNYINRKLYEFGSEIDAATYIHSVNPDNTANTALFTLDSKWNRIVYSKRGSSDIKSYGENPNDCIFDEPTAIETNEYNHVYVLDKYNRKIHKLVYNYDMNILNYFEPLNIPEGILKAPVDIDYNSNLTAFDNSDDYILVSDVQRKSILKFSINGTLLKEYKTYRYAGVTQTIGYPTRLAVYLTDCVAFIDPSKNAIIFGTLTENEIECNSSQPTCLTPNYRPTDITVTLGYNIVVSDGIGMIHKFDWLGHYMCSYNNPSSPLAFYDTRRLSNSMATNPQWGLLDVSVNDRWSLNKGAKRFLPGADAIQLLANDDGAYIRLSCLFTDPCFYKLELIKVSDNSIVSTYTNESRWLGGVADFMIINKNTLVGGAYKFKVSVLPYYYNNYNNTAVEWTSRELIFDPQIVAPVISGFTQTPAPIYKGISGSVTCNLSQGNGNLTYTWSSIDLKPGVSVTFNGNKATVTYNQTESIKANNKSNIPSEDYTHLNRLRCTVNNGTTPYTKDFTLFLADRPATGCPFVYTWNGEDWIEDNNILPQSQDSTILGQDVTDFYQLFTKPHLESASGGEKYYLTVGEFEQERSYLDQVKLMVVDHPQETFITVNDEGQIIEFAKPAYFASADLDSIDVYRQLYRFDEEKVTAQRDETMRLNFEDISGSEEKWLLLIGQASALGAKERIAGSVMDRNKESFTSFRLRRNPSYQWLLVPQGNSSTLQVDILWKGESEVDYAELSNKLELPFTLYTPELISAEHSAVGDVRDPLLY